MLILGNLLSKDPDVETQSWLGYDVSPDGKKETKSGFRPGLPKPQLPNNLQKQLQTKRNALGRK